MDDAAVWVEPNRIPRPITHTLHPPNPPHLTCMLWEHPAAT